MGVTGTRAEITTDIRSMIELVRRSTNIPCAVGFGISKPEQAAEMAGLSDGVIVGSAIVKIIAEEGKDSVFHIGGYVRSMKDTIRDI